MTVISSNFLIIARERMHEVHHDEGNFDPRSCNSNNDTQIGSGLRFRKQMSGRIR